MDDLYYSSGGNGSATGIFNTFLDAIDGSYCTYSAYGETGNDPTLDPQYPDTADPTGYQGSLECGVYQATNVISISYGEQESDLPAYYQQRQCNEFLKLGLQGVSIFVASGDTGVGGYPGQNTTYGCLGDDDKVFSPTQPNSCPWLTNVGATKVYEGKTVFEPESAVFDIGKRSNYTSGGVSRPPAFMDCYEKLIFPKGFSNIFTAPSYQQAAIDTFFSDHNPPYPYYYNGNYQNATNGGVYNRNGRGIPDVAANGVSICGNSLFVLLRS